MFLLQIPLQDHLERVSLIFLFRYVLYELLCSFYYQDIIVFSQQNSSFYRRL